MTGAALVGTNSTSGLEIGSGNYLNFENITITNAHAGGLRIDGDSDITLSNGTRITKNWADYYLQNTGGGVYVKDATLTINGAEISGNTATEGGGLYATNAVVTINSGLFTANTSGMYGGGIRMDGVTFTMNGGVISANQGSNGGGLYVSYTSDVPKSNVTINSGAITRNRSVASGYVGDGGGVFVSSGIFTMNGGTISGNTAEGGYHQSWGNTGGGGICVWTEFGIVTISGGAIKNNDSLKNGGGIYVYKGKLTYTSGTISGNTAGMNGNSICKHSTAGGTVTPSAILTGGDYADGDITLP